MYITKQAVTNRNYYTMSLPLTNEQLRQIEERSTPIQNIPGANKLTPEQREFLISGMPPFVWESLLAKHNDHVKRTQLENEVYSLAYVVINKKTVYLMMGGLLHRAPVFSDDVINETGRLFDIKELKEVPKEDGDYDIKNYFE